MLDAELRFATYREFVAQQEAIERLVFRSGLMPGARLTMDRFWSPFSGGPAPGAALAEHLAALSGEQAPGAPGPAVAAPPIERKLCWPLLYGTLRRDGRSAGEPLPARKTADPPAQKAAAWLTPPCRGRLSSGGSRRTGLGRGNGGRISIRP
jgi:hypothetical protein